MYLIDWATVFLDLYFQRSKGKGQRTNMSVSGPRHATPGIDSTRLLHLETEKITTTPEICGWMLNGRNGERERSRERESPVSIGEDSPNQV